MFLFIEFRKYERDSNTNRIIIRIGNNFYHFKNNTLNISVEESDKR